MKTPMQKMIDYLCSIGEYDIVDKANELLKEEKEIPDSIEIKEKAMQMDEKEFEQWWYETVYKE